MKELIAVVLLVGASLLVQGDAASRIKGIGPGSQINWGAGTGLLYIEQGTAFVATCQGCTVTPDGAGGRTITFPNAPPPLVLPIPRQREISVPAAAGTVEQFSFELDAVPIPNTLAVIRNGAIQRPGADYSISGATVTLLHTKCDIGTTSGGCWWTPDDWVLVMYLRLP